MRRTRAPLSAFGLLWRTAAIVTAVVIGPAAAWLVGEWVHELRHPARLGRTSEEIVRRVDERLPVGTSADSALAYFRSLGVTAELYAASEAPRSLPGDTLLAGGPVILAVEPDTGHLFGGWIGSVRLYFTPAGRLARRDARLSAINPL